MSTQAALEEQMYSALLDVNTHRLQAHTAATGADLDSAYAAFENMISHANKGKAALDQLLDILRDQRLEELDNWRNEHHESECDDHPGECERDHDEERADSLNETRWEEWRDAG